MNYEKLGSTRCEMPYRRHTIPVGVAVSVGSSAVSLCHRARLIRLHVCLSALRPRFQCVDSKMTTAGLRHNAAVEFQPDLVGTRCVYVSKEALVLVRHDTISDCGSGKCDGTLKELRHRESVTTTWRTVE